MTTYHAKTEEVPHAWLLVDLEGKTLGRAASTIAQLLRGKHKPQYTPSVDTGDFVIAVNAKAVQLTGNKRQAKLYHRHTGYMGGLRSATAEEVLASDKPEEVLISAVRGMLPKNSLGRKLLKKLKVYGGAEHPHAAQLPKVFEL